MVGSQECLDDTQDRVIESLRQTGVSSAALPRANNLVPQKPWKIQTVWELGEAGVGVRSLWKYP